jgi:hypothetical protein
MRLPRLCLKINLSRGIGRIVLLIVQRGVKLLGSLRMVQQTR